MVKPQKLEALAMLVSWATSGLPLNAESLHFTLIQRINE